MEETKTLYRVTLKDEYNTTATTRDLDRLKELPRFKKHWRTAKIEEVIEPVNVDTLVEE